VKKDDKLYKVREYADMLNSKFAKFGVFSHNLSIDEQMIPYFGRHSCNMFTKGKPVIFGYKSWCLCSSDGYFFPVSSIRWSRWKLWWLSGSL